MSTHPPTPPSGDPSHSYPQTHPQQGYPQTYPQQGYPQTYPQQGHPQGYPQGYGYGYGGGTPGPPPSNGLAIAALVLGIVGLLGSLVPILGWFASPFALAAVGFGIAGMSRGKAIGRGRGMAVAGLVTGVLGLLVITAWTVFIVVGTNETADLYSGDGIFGCEATRSGLERAVDEFRADEGREPESEDELIDGGYISLISSDFDVEVIDGEARVVEEPGGDC